VLLVTNIWFVRTLYRTLASADVIIAPIKVNGAGSDSAAMGEALSRMLLARWDRARPAAADVLNVVCGI
jgi:hypothetical protein